MAYDPNASVASVLAALDARLTLLDGGGTVTPTPTPTPPGPTPTLAPLTLSGPLQIGTAATGTITGATAGSTIASNIPGVAVNSAARTYAGTPTGAAGSIANGLVETLAGAVGSPRSSAVTVAAAAVVTPSAQFIAVVPITGQSDAAGRGVYSASIDVNDPKVKQYPSDPGSTTTYRTIRDSIYPLYHPEGANSDQIGPGPTLGKRLAAQLGPNCVYVLLVPCAFGNTGLINGGGRWQVGGDLHEAAVAQTTAAVAAAQALYPASYVHCEAWVQGNSDGATSQAAYEAGLTARIADMRARVPTMSAATPFVIGSMLPIAIEGQPDKQKIELAQMNVAATVPNVFYVPGPYGSTRSDESPDFIHMGTTGCRTVGTNLANAALGVRTVDFARSGASATEGQSGTTTLSYLAFRSDAGAAVTAFVTIAPGTTDGADFGGAVPTPAVTWAAGQNRANFTVAVSGDVDVESDENFTLTMSAPSGYVVGTRPTATGRITNDDTGVVLPATDMPAAALYAYYDMSDRATLFQDEARTVPVTAAGQPVMGVADKSGNGRHATGVGSPVLGAIGARDAITLDGSTQYLPADVVAAVMATTASEFTIHSVGFQPADGTPANRALWGGGHTSGTTTRHLSTDLSTGVARYSYRGTGGGGLLSAPIGPTIRGARVVTSTRRKADGTIDIRRNGEVIPPNAGSSPTSSVTKFTIGGRVSQGTVIELYAGQVGSLAAYSIAQSDADFAAAHDVLIAKWA